MATAHRDEPLSKRIYMSVSPGPHEWLTYQTPMPLRKPPRRSYSTRSCPSNASSQHPPFRWSEDQTSKGLLIRIRLRLGLKDATGLKEVSPLSLVQHLPSPILAPEIYRAIVDALDPQVDLDTLLTLAPVSKAFYSEAIRAIYFDVGGDISMSTKRHIGFLKSAGESPKLARLVKRYQFSMYESDRGMASTVLNLLQRTLPRLINLIHFSFTGNGVTPAGRILPFSNYHMKSFYWRGVPADEKEVSAFLLCQESITKVDTTWHDTPLHENALPYLEQLRGPVTTVIAFLRPRGKVRVLHWIPGTEDHRIILALIRTTLPAFSSIRILSFGGDAVDILLSGMMKYLQSVEILELISAKGLDLPGDAWRIPNLSVLVLSKMRGCICSVVGTNHLQMAKTMFEKNRILDRIDIVVRNHGQITLGERDLMYERWSRYSLESAIVSGAEALAWKYSSFAK